MDGGAPAIAAALEQALGGVSLDDLPLLPEDLYRAVRDAAKRRRG
jgi:CO/xanthine dehydrogenase Mo-binding subunit